MRNPSLHRSLSALLAVMLLLSCALSASAEELAGETQPQSAQTTVPSETTEPPETTLPTEQETTEPTETTVPATPETQPAEPPTLPADTEPGEDPTESTENTTAPTEAPQETAAAARQTPVFVTAAEAWAMPPSETLLTLRGTIVYLSGTQAVLQDSTGGIRLSFPEAPVAALGDVLDVTGKRSGGFSVTEYAFVGTATLPAVETTLYDAPENLRVRIQNATVSGGNLCQNGTIITLIATVPASAEGTKVDAYGVILDGRFYADSIVSIPNAEETVEEETGAYHLYFGQLHAHTALSDGWGTVEEAFQYASQVEGLDFFAVTDHSNSFDNAELGAIDEDGASVSQEWAEGKAAAAAVTDETFVGIFGYEMTWREVNSLGHIGTFNTPGWQTRDQAGMDTLTGYYDVLTTVPDSISQFNHPSHSYGNFQYFAHYSPTYDQVIQLLEVGCEGKTAYDWYNEALDQGWHVAPTNNQNNHNGSWGSETAVRTVILAEELTEQSLFEAIRSRRVYATEDSDLAIRYMLNGKIMGSILGQASELTVSLEAEDLTDGVIGTVEVIVDGGETAASREMSGGTLTMEVPAGHSYYYLRITQPDGDVAVTAPVWVDGFEDMGIGKFSCDVESPLDGEEVTVTLELYNHEAVDMLLETVEFSMDGTVLGRITDPGMIVSMGTRSYAMPVTCTASGEMRILATVTGTVAGVDRTWEETLVLRCSTGASSETTDIGQLRSGVPGTAYRIKGYATTGTDNPYNAFPDTVYVQDDTGGIAVTGTFDQEVKIGDALVAEGILLEQGGALVLELTRYELTGETAYRYVPTTLANAVAMNYGLNGGELLQIEGEVVSLTKTADGSGVSRFTIRDVRGTLATVVIEDYIRSGAHGTNTLATKVLKGRTVRAMGLLHVDEYGEAVLRVRNCDEVVYVPPAADPSNPKTGDRFWVWFWK